MKHILLKLALLLITVPAFSQSNDIYLDGSINLIEDNSFGEGINWQNIFNNDAQIGRLRDNIAVADDGTVFVSNYKDNTISIINSDGEYLKTFGRKGSNPGEFAIHVELHSVWNNQYLITSDGRGRIQFFDYDGNLWKLVKVDYMVKSVIPLENNKLAILGFVVITGGWKNIISIKDISTETEKIIWSRETKSVDRIGTIKIENPRDEIDKTIFEDNILARIPDEESKALMAGVYKLNDDGTKYLFLKNESFKNNWQKVYELFKTVGYGNGYYTFTNPSTREHSFISKLADGNIALGVTTIPELLVFSPEGQQMRTIDLAINPVRITEEDKNQFYENTVNELIQFDLDPTAAEKIKDDGFFPEYLPYYYDMISDSNGSLLLFTYTQDIPEYRFNVYTISPDGQIVRNCLLNSQDYLLNLSPQINNKAIRNNQFYSIVGEIDGVNQKVRLLKAQMD